MGDVVQCPGCYQVVDVSRPPGVDFNVARARTSSGQEAIRITIGQIAVHECRLCRDGEWR